MDSLQPFFNTFNAVKSLSSWIKSLDDSPFSRTKRSLRVQIRSSILEAKVWTEDEPCFNPASSFCTAAMVVLGLNRFLRCFSKSAKVLMFVLMANLAFPLSFTFNKYWRKSGLEVSFNMLKYKRAQSKKSFNCSALPVKSGTVAPAAFKSKSKLIVALEAGGVVGEARAFVKKVLALVYKFFTSSVFNSVGIFNHKVSSAIDF